LFEMIQSMILIKEFFSKEPKLSKIFSSFIGKCLWVF